MKNILLPTLLSACTIFMLSSCKTNDSLVNSSEDVVVTVNGKAITEAAIKSLKTEAAVYNKRIKVSRKQLVAELINRELLYQQAVKHELDKKPETIDRIETAKRAILFKSEMQNYMGKLDISQAELQEEYKRQAEKTKENLIEYKARHILTSSKEEAEKIITSLNKGQNFSELAKQFSIDTSAKKGGDLGWFNAKQMVPEFSEALSLLKKGGYSQTPVRSGRGWHIIFRENFRTKQPPALEKVRQSLENRLKYVKFQDYIGDLKKNASIIHQ